MTRDARLSALHRGGFWASGPRFRLLRRPPSYNGGQLPSGSVQRAPRSQVVVPAGGVPGLPGQAVTSRLPQDATPRSAFRMSPETPLDERGCESISTASICSQEKYSIRSRWPSPPAVGAQRMPSPSGDWYRSIRSRLRQLAPLVGLHAHDQFISAAAGLEHRGLAFAHVEPVLAEGVENIGLVGDDDDIGAGGRHRRRELTQRLGAPI